MGRSLRRSRRRHRAPRSFAPPRRRRPNRRNELSAPPACRSHAGARPLQSPHQLANPGTITAPPRSTAQKRSPRSRRRLITHTRKLGNFTSAQVGKVQAALTDEAISGLAQTGDLTGVANPLGAVDEGTHWIMEVGEGAVAI